MSRQPELCSPFSRRPDDLWVLRDLPPRANTGSGGGGGGWAPLPAPGPALRGPGRDAQVFRDRA